MENEKEVSSSEVIEQPHSVKISINAKGNYSGEVKCYGPTPEIAMNRTTALAKDLDALIKEKNGN